VKQVGFKVLQLDSQQHSCYYAISQHYNYLYVKRNVLAAVTVSLSTEQFNWENPMTITCDFVGRLNNK